MVDENTHKLVEEVIVDETGTHRIRGTNNSDHNTILMTINTTVQTTQEKRRKWKKATEENWKKFNQIMEKNKNKIMNYNQLENNINTALKEAIGVQTISTTNSKRGKETKEIKHLREARNQLRKKLSQEIKNEGKNKPEILQTDARTSTVT